MVCAADHFWSFNVANLNSGTSFSLYSIQLRNGVPSGPIFKFTWELSIAAGGGISRRFPSVVCLVWLHPASIAATLNSKPIRRTDLFTLIRFPLTRPTQDTHRRYFLSKEFYIWNDTTLLLNDALLRYKGVANTIRLSIRSSIWFS